MIQNRLKAIKRSIIIIFLSFSTHFFPLYAQEKGVTPESTEAQDVEPKNYWALIIGISEYEYFNSLDYADKDALMFYEYLKSDLGDKLPDHNVKILLNEEATGAAIEKGFGWLVKNVEEGDIVYIYYSGHGGQEDLSYKKLGYLIGHNSFDNTLSNGGNYPMFYLQTILETLSFQNKATTYFIADACHSGKSDGEDLEYFNTTLSSEVGQITKVLSAQGNELSFENAKWGGGHGVFTYYLVKGLAGEADNSPKDGIVTIRELNRYLDDHVPPETNFKQNPTIISQNVLSKVSVINEDFLASLNSESLNLELDHSSLLASRNVVDGFTEEDMVFYDSVVNLLKQYNFHNKANSGALDLFDDYFEKHNNERLKSQLLEKIYISGMDYTQDFINMFLSDSHKRDSINYDENDAIQLLEWMEPKYTIEMEKNQIDSRTIFFKSVKVHWDYHTGILTDSDVWIGIIRVLAAS